MTEDEEKTLRGKISREILTKGPEWLVNVEDPRSLWMLAVKVCAQIARDGKAKG